MSKSIQEEIIAALWMICAILSFGFGFTGWGFVFTCKAVFDIFVSIKFGIKESRNEKEIVK